MFLLLATLLLSSCKTKVKDFEWCETEPIYGQGLCFYVFSKKTRVIPLLEWRGMQPGRISLSRAHALQLVHDLRNLCFQDKVKCMAQIDEIENKMKGKK